MTYQSLRIALYYLCSLFSEKAKDGLIGLSRLFLYFFLFIMTTAAIFKAVVFLLLFEPNRNQTRTTKLTNKTKYITKMNRKVKCIS